MPNKWFSKVKVVHMDHNYGDWGGMLQAIPHIHKNSRFIVQLDNDIVVPKGWLLAMIKILNSDANVVMLKRNGVKGTLNPNKIINIDNLQIGYVAWATACWMVRTDHFIREASKHSICDSFTRHCGKIRKIINLSCLQLEGWDQINKGSYIQHEKYLPYKDHIR